MKYQLETDDQFRRLIPPLSPAEHEQLEQGIVLNGCREPLCVWNNIILDGHERYEICTRLGIPFAVVHVFLKTRDDAVAWICANQLDHRNIPEKARRYLIGKQYEAQKNTFVFHSSRANQRGKRELWPQHETGPHATRAIGLIRERLAHAYSVSEPTIARYGHYARAIDDLAKSDPLLSRKILSGETAMTHDHVVALARLDPSDKSVAAPSSDGMEDVIGCPRSLKTLKPKRFAGKKAPPVRSSVSVKAPPAYDPDALAKSLIFTIPSWIRAIERTAAETDCTAITPVAHLNLKNTLHRLAMAAQAMADMMEETAHEQ